MKIAIALALILAASMPAAAQEVIPWPHRDGLGPIQLVEHRSEIRIREQVADVTIDATFHNANDVELEGMYFMNLPAGAQVSRFSMTVNGKEMAAELLDSKKAREIYDKIVNARRDPALLELVGQQMLKCSVYPIGPKSDVKVRIGYTQPLAQDGGFIGLTMPLAKNLTGDRAIKQVVLTGSIESRTGLKTIFSPTHAIDVAKKDDHHAKFSLEAKDYASKQDFQLFYSLSDADIGVNLLTFREGGQDGFFILMATPKVALDQNRVVPKDVVFIIDRSGSMSGDKIKQAREALRLCVQSLNKGDRFNIVDFSTEVHSYDPELVNAEEHRDKGMRYAEGLPAKGSTNIDGALTTGMAMLKRDPKRMSMVLFMTDGLPTVGEQNTESILKNARSRIPDGVDARIFVFGVGNDVNTQFLDRLAEEGRGARDYVAPQEQIEGKVSALFEKIAHPVLASITVDYGGAKPLDLYPKQMPDLFKGQQLTLYGRFKGAGPTTITLKGLAAGEEKSYRYDVSFPEKDIKCDFIPRLWAGRKVAFLVDAIRMGGNADKEVIDEIVSLGRKYGIVTQYTSFLITEDDAGKNAAGRAGEALKEMAEEARQSGGAAAPKPAEDTQGLSKDLEQKKKGDQSVDKLEAEGYALRRKALDRGGKVVSMKSIGSKTFYQRGGVWTDGGYDEKDKDKIVKVKFLGEDYRKLIDDNPELAKYLAVGGNVIVCWNGRIYQVETETEKK